MQINLQDRQVVALRIFSGDKDALSEEEMKWMQASSISSGPRGNNPSIITYEMKLSDEFFALLEKYERNVIDPALFFFLKRLCENESFHLIEHDAFEIVTSLYATCIHVLKPRVGNWHYSQADTYEIEFNADSRSLSIIFPSMLIGLLKGKQHANIKRLRHFLRPTIERVIIVQ